MAVEIASRLLFAELVQYNQCLQSLVYTFAEDYRNKASVAQKLKRRHAQPLFAFGAPVQANASKGAEQGVAEKDVAIG